jgi:hypothetical protein
MKVDVPAGELQQSLHHFAEQSGVEFIYSADQLEGVQTQAVYGGSSAEKAVSKLLEGAKLQRLRQSSGVRSRRPTPIQDYVLQPNTGNADYATLPRERSSGPRARRRRGAPLAPRRGRCLDYKLTSNPLGGSGPSSARPQCSSVELLSHPFNRSPHPSRAALPLWNSAPNIDSVRELSRLHSHCFHLNMHASKACRA